MTINGEGLSFSIDQTAFIIENPLLGCRVKIERARAHLGELSEEIKAWWKSEPYVIYTGFIEEEKTIYYKIHISKSQSSISQTHIKWSAIIGDIIHNLRSSYDLLAFSLVINGGGTPSRDTQWPTAKDEGKFAKSVKRSLKGASEAAMQLASQSPSYWTGSNLVCPIYVLHELDVGDKHHALMPVGGASYGEAIPGVPVSHTRRPEEAFIGLFNGLTLLEHSANGPDDPRVLIDLDIVFGNGNILRGFSVVNTLNSLLIYTEEFIDKANKQIFHLDQW